MAPIEERRATLRTFAHSDEDFDRIGFAMKALAVLGPSQRVAVHEGRTLGVEHGRPSGPRWATVSIPPDASRAHIAWVLADLVGVADKPWMIDTLLHLPSGSDAERRVRLGVPSSQPS